MNSPAVPPTLMFMTSAYSVYYHTRSLCNGWSSRQEILGQSLSSCPHKSIQPASFDCAPTIHSSLCKSMTCLLTLTLRFILNMRLIIVIPSAFVKVAFVFFDTLNRFKKYLRWFPSPRIPAFQYFPSALKPASHHCGQRSLRKCPLPLNNGWTTSA